MNPIQAGDTTPYMGDESNVGPVVSQDNTISVK